MVDYLPIRTLVWDGWNLKHIEKHGMVRHEIEAMIFSGGAQVIIETYKGRLQILGETTSGRVLSVILGPDRMGEHGDFYVFSARPASRRERRHFSKRQEGQEP